MALPKNKETDQLFRSILALRSVEECYRYFDDLCTVHEIQAIAQRLADGQSYQNTIAGTGAAPPPSAGSSAA